MARKEKTRTVGIIPEYVSFSPAGISNGESVVLTIDELEAIRLIDLSKCSQETAAEQMNVARTTVTAIYERARYKLADVLVNGKTLHIEGGSVEFLPLKESDETEGPGDKGEKTMRIAAAYADGEIFQHFGRCEFFKIYDTENSRVISSKICSTNGAGHGAIPAFLKENDVDTLICGGIGGGAQAKLKEAGIIFYGGVSGSADDAVKKLLAGSLKYDPDVVCIGEHNCGQEHEKG